MIFKEIGQVRDIHGVFVAFWREYVFFLLLSNVLMSLSAAMLIMVTVFDTPLPRSLGRHACPPTFKMGLQFPTIFWPPAEQFLGKVGRNWTLLGDGSHIEFINFHALRCVGRAGRLHPWCWGLPKTFGHCLVLSAGGR